VPRLFIFLLAAASLAFPQSEPVRIIAFGAHPDDCDSKFGGTAILLARMGHAVKFVSVTNGDAGHQTMGGGELARRRKAEAREAGRRFGIAEYEVLDNHDGELMPTLEVRRQVIQRIREWRADVVISPRPNDYHPDHRYTGVLVQDAAYMVVVPNIVPHAPALRRNPVFLYFSDNFQKPAPFRPDIAVDIGDAVAQKVEAMDAHVSQYYEWLPWVDGRLDQVPKDPAARKQWLAGRRPQTLSTQVRAALEKWYGKERAAKATACEAFEVCEYGRRPSDDDIRRLFPMLK
jgi:LmbE family N-acetylglucosaminyl deacetylase